MVAAAVGIGGPIAISHQLLLVVMGAEVVTQLVTESVEGGECTALTVDMDIYQISRVSTSPWP